VTIIPRGHALGVTMYLPAEEKHNWSRGYVESRIAVLLGGRVAEELTQTDITTGAGNDIERATALARQMVCEWGMSELGPLAYSGGEEPVFLGRDYGQRAVYSDTTAERIDEEVRRIIAAANEKARAILARRREALERLAAELLERESLEAEEVYRLIERVTGERVAVQVPVRRPKDAGPASPVAAPAPDAAPEVGRDLNPRPSPA
jgi:cell division protease FtsH